MPEKAKNFFASVSEVHREGKIPWIEVTYRDERLDIPKVITGTAARVDDGHLRVEWRVSVRDKVSHKTIPLYRIIDGKITGYF